jgi:hypothetical protein
MAKKLPKWETDEEYFEWARGEARDVLPVDWMPITPLMEIIGAGKRYDAYNGTQNEDDG